MAGNAASSEETLLVHGSDYSEEELLLGQDVLDELNLSAGNFVELWAVGGGGNAGVAGAVGSTPHQAASEQPGRSLVLRVPSKIAPTKVAFRLSILRSVADAFGLSVRQPVILRFVTMQDAALDWVELGFKDQHLSRGDIWHFRRHLLNHEPTVHVGKTISFEAIRAQVVRMVRGGRRAASGVLVNDTKLRFRSRSAAFVLLIQVSAEMGEFDAASGELFHEKAIGFLRRLFRRWKSLGVSHSLSIVLFCRCYADTNLAGDAAWGTGSHARMPADDAVGGGAKSAGGGATADDIGDTRTTELMVDTAGRAYSDYYKLVAENEIRDDWEPMLPSLKRHFLSFGPSLKRREPTTSALPGSAEVQSGGCGSTRNSTAAHGNLLEAINLALDVLESTHEEQDLSSTGKSIVCLSAGTGWFEVDQRLSQITKQRLTDNGIGCDLVCCGSPPLHTVPLFTYTHPASPGQFGGEAPKFRVPHWMLVSYTDAPPPSPFPSCRVTPAPRHRMDQQGDTTAAEGEARVIDSIATARSLPSGSPALLLPCNVPPLPEPAPGSNDRSTPKDPFDLAASLPEGDVFAPPSINSSWKLDHRATIESIDSGLPIIDVGDGGAESPHGNGSGAAGDKKSDGDDDADEMAYGRVDTDAPNEGATFADMGSTRMHRTERTAQPRSRSSKTLRSPKRRPIASQDSFDSFIHGGLRVRTSSEASGGSSADSRPIPTTCHIPTRNSEESFSPQSDYMYSSSQGSNPSCSLPNSEMGLPSFGLPQSCIACSPSTFQSALDSFSERSSLGANAGANRPLLQAQGDIPEHSNGQHSRYATNAPSDRTLRASGSSRRRFLFNPFSPSDAQALKKLSHNSNARRRWQHVNHIGHDNAVEGGYATYSNSSVLQHLEHQWTSLSEPAVLPLTTDPTDEHLQVMHAQHSAESSLWQLDVPRQEELSGIPYEHAMSAEELLQELLCQRLEQDFQLLRPRNQPKLLSLTQDQTYYLCQASQVQQITFVQPDVPRGPATASPDVLRNAGRFLPSSSRYSRATSADSGAAAKAGEGSPKPLGFSEIRVTRHLLQGRYDRDRAERSMKDRQLSAVDKPFGYHYFVCGPHIHGYQRAYSQIKVTTPHDYPWNRLDQIVCGWNCELDLKLRPRCKRFALLDFQQQREDSLRRLLTAPAGTQRLLSAMLPQSSATPSSSSTIGGASIGASLAVGPSCTDSHAPSPSPKHNSASGTSMAGREERQEESGNANGPNESWRDVHAPSLSRDRFERFVAAVRSRLPIGDRVEWVDGNTVDPDSGGAGAGGSGAARMHSQLLDMTSPTSHHGDTGAVGRARRMYVQLLFDANASPDQAWHLEIRWNMCQGQKVEELAKFCARRAKSAGLLFIQVPTGRRFRPFSPPVLVPIPRSLQSRALLELRTQLCFLRESAYAGADLHAGRSTAALGDRWMHELGVAFVQRDQYGRGFLWTVSRLLPAQAGRSLSEHLLARFRELCEELVIEDSMVRAEAEARAQMIEAEVESRRSEAATAVHERSLSGSRSEAPAVTRERSLSASRSEVPVTLRQRSFSTGHAELMAAPTAGTTPMPHAFGTASDGGGYMPTQSSSGPGGAVAMGEATSNASSSHAT